MHILKKCLKKILQNPMKCLVSNNKSYQLWDKIFSLSKEMYTAMFHSCKIWKSILLPRIKIKLFPTLILRLGWKCNEAVLFSSTLQ